MPTVTVHAYADLRQFLGGQPMVQLEIARGISVRDVLRQIGIPPEKTRIVFVDGRAAELDAVLGGGEKIDLFSAIGGG